MVQRERERERVSRLGFGLLDDQHRTVSMVGAEITDAA